MGRAVCLGGGVCPGADCLGGVCPGAGCLAGVCPGEVSASADNRSPPWIESQTGVKTLPFRKVLLRTVINGVRVDNWTAELAIIASNATRCDRSKCELFVFVNIRCWLGNYTATLVTHFKFVKCKLLSARSARITYRENPIEVNFLNRHWFYFSKLFSSTQSPLVEHSSSGVEV